MSDPADNSGIPLAPASADGLPHGDRLEAILADPTLPDRDKRLAIQEALEDLQRSRGEEVAASYEPLERRFFEALSLLADGGHDYDEPGASQEADPLKARRDDGL
ncbi:hypothetical protein [Aureimonas sp. SK2]|uniref:hypothetical protein n=1 Tax=Aureimonas sp. SK2 TaxID=3015992 RepID=UPI002444544F|nr:hypothetical protein [Aureimonas sp. SK2]